MKILIVTVYNSHNSGSFLQAYALKSVLTDMGYEVRFLERDILGSSHDLTVVAKTSLRCFLHGHITQSINVIRQWFIYEKLQRSFLIEKQNSDYYHNADVIVLGSDTIWNFMSSYFLQNASTYLGAKFDGKRVITYAASVGNTPLQTFSEVVSRNKGLSNVETILVRDTHTFNLVEALGRTALQVTDPTLIAQKECFNVFFKPISSKRPFLLLYYFGKIPKNLKKAIIEYASRQNLIIYSMPENRNWCYKSVLSSPHNMISYFSAAESIITNTFHGTAFSLIFEKPFAVFDSGKNKVEELLCRYGEKDRLFSDSEKLQNILSLKNQVVMSGRFDNIRKDSLEKLNNAICSERQ